VDREWIKSGIRRREDRHGKGNGRGMEGEWNEMDDIRNLG